MTEKIIDKLKKIKALADAGDSGEATAAKELLKKQLYKYGLTMATLKEEELKPYLLYYTTEFDRVLLVQIGHMMGLDIWTVKEGGRLVRKLRIDCTPMIFSEVMNLYEFHKTTFAKELDKLQIAYIQKHQIFKRDGKPKDINELNPEEKKKILAALKMMESLENKQFSNQKMIEG